MTLNQIQYFCEVAARENFRAAAEALHLSQPSLSRAIANLEDELGLALFEKSGRGVVLTKAGRLFREYCAAILDACEIASTKMSEIARGGGTIDLGYVFPLAGRFIPHHVRAFLSQEGNEEIHFNFWQNHTPAIIEKVQDGSLDVGFGGCVDRIDLEYFPLFSQDLILVTPLKHPLAGKESVSLHELENYPVVGYDPQSWMGIHTAELYRQTNIHPDIVTECPDEYSIISLVREDFGIALIPKTEVAEFMDGIEMHSLSDYQLAHQIYMFWKKDCEHLPVVDRFIEYMKQCADPANDSFSLSKTYLKDIVTIN